MWGGERQGGGCVRVVGGKDAVGDVEQRATAERAMEASASLDGGAANCRSGVPCRALAGAVGARLVTPSGRQSCRADGIGIFGWMNARERRTETPTGIWEIHAVGALAYGCIRRGCV